MLRTGGARDGEVEQRHCEALEDLENNLQLNDQGDQITLTIGGAISAPGGTNTLTELEAHVTAKGGTSADVGINLDGL